MNQIKILGVKLDNLKLKNVLKQVDNFLNSKSQHYIVTTNPEFLIQANKDQEFKKILNNSDLSLADGFGILLAGLVKGKFINRISGADLMMDICKVAEQKNSSVFLLGSSGNIAESAAKNLKSKFTDLNIVGAERGLDKSSTKEEEMELVKRINKTKPEIIFVAFGAPKQEKWINENMAKISSLRLAMGVGGTFDYIAGKTKRAPKIWRSMGLEWLWRVILQPFRIFRIVKAVIYFPVLFVFKDLLKKP